MISVRERMRIRGWMSAHRHAFPFSLLTPLAEKYLRAVKNEVNWDIRFNGERAAIEAAVQHFPGALFDVGANVGKWAKAAQAIAGDRVIHCFEIAPPTYATLKKRMAGNANMILNDFGLSEAAGDVVLHHYPENIDRTSMVSMDDGYRKIAMTARVMTGDDYARQHGVEDIALLKLDVEGAEISVLRGFSKMLAAQRIHMVQFEHGPQHVYSRSFLKDFLDLFTPFGYSVFYLYPNGISKLNYDPAHDESFVGQNFIACRNDVRFGAPLLRERDQKPNGR